MRFISSTFTAIKQNIIINAIAALLLAFLFYTELNLCHYFYYDWSVIKARENIDFSGSTYSFILDTPIDRYKLERLMNDYTGTLPQYEDVVITDRINESEHSTDLVAFYDGISIFHRFVSFDSNERLTDKVLSSGNVIGSNESGEEPTRVINGKSYRLVRQVTNLKAYADWSEVLCCSYEEFFKITDNVDKICFEYQNALSKSEINELEKCIEKYATIKAHIIPDSEIQESINTIGNIIYPIVEVFLVMAVVSTCVLPIIRYCLMKRHHEFRSYRMCGASNRFIVSCEITHVLVIGISSMLLGILLSLNNFKTRGFWLMLLLCVILFLLRLLIEVLIDSRASYATTEVNKKWRL